MNSAERKREYNKKYREEHKEHLNKIINERNKERYYTDEEYRKKTIESSKISVKKQRELKKNILNTT